MSGRAPLIVLILVGAVLVAGLVASPFFTGPATGQEKAEYKGSDKCKSCHKDQYAAWQEMKHAKAFAALTPEQIASGKDDKGRTCVECHTTGFGDGGFTSADETPKLVNVGCESCHGPAGTHIKTMLAAMMDETEVTDKHISKSVGCVKCHNPHIQYGKIYGGE
jgi:Cytochrome c554 and c-prime